MMQQKLKRSNLQRHHVFFAVLCIVLLGLCIYYGWRGVYFLQYEFLYMRGTNKFVGKKTEIHMKKSNDTFYFTIKDKDSGEQEKVTLCWTEEISDGLKEYKIIFDEKNTERGVWTENKDREFVAIYGWLGESGGVREDVTWNKCRALCRIAAGHYEKQGNVLKGLLGVCVFLAGVWCCLPYSDEIFIKSGLRKIEFGKYLRILEVVLGVSLVICGIGITCDDYIAQLVERLWFELQRDIIY